MHVRVKPHLNLDTHRVTDIRHALISMASHTTKGTGGTGADQVIGAAATDRQLANSQKALVYSHACIEGLINHLGRRDEAWCVESGVWVMGG